MSPRFIKNLPRTFPSDDGPDDCIGIRKVRGLLKKYRIQPSKRLGQNFLIDKRAIKKIVEAAEIKPTDVILEIGPGLGALTLELAKKAGKVIAVEKDPKMVEILKETLREFENIEIVQEDILRFQFLNSKFETRNSKQIRNSNVPNSKRFEISNLENWDLFRISDFGFRAFKVVANLPFYLTAPVIRKFLESPARPKMMVLVVQKEVAERICALPAKASASQKFRMARPPKMSILAVSVQVYAEPKIISYISKKSFWPQPEVDAAILKIIPKPQSVQSPELCTFFEIVKTGFSHPRKQILNNLCQELASRLSKKGEGLAISLPEKVKLSKGSGKAGALPLSKEKIKDWLLENNIRPTQRAETLTIEDWLNLTKTFPNNFSK